MQADPTLHLPVNHVFVDFENVKTIDPSVIGGKNLMLHLFFGAQNKKLDLEVVELLLENAHAVNLIRCPKSGKNALDFVLAYHLGQAVQTDPKGYFHIVSKDMGFDALVELLRSRKVKVKQHPDWSGLRFNSPVKVPVPVPVPVPTQALHAEAEKVLENLRKTEKNRPKRKKTLLSHSLSFLGKGVSAAKCEQVVEELSVSGYLMIDDKGVVTYKL
jgi:hypothetical protein